MALATTGRLAGKVAVVTGAACGIGLATAERLAQAGAAVMLADLDARAVDRAAEGLVGQGRMAAAIRVNVAQRIDVAAMVEASEARFGRVDILVNNAGIAGRVPSLRRALPRASASTSAAEGRRTELGASAFGQPRTGGSNKHRANGKAFPRINEDTCTMARVRPPEIGKGGARGRTRPT